MTPLTLPQFRTSVADLTADMVASPCSGAFAWVKFITRDEYAAQSLVLRAGVAGLTARIKVARQDLFVVDVSGFNWRS